MEIKLNNLSKHADLQAGKQIWIHPTSVQLKSGEFNILLGKTHAGKTTLLRLLAGLEKPTTGEILFAGDDVTSLSTQRRNIAMVYQQFINYPGWNVFDNIASPLKVSGESKASIKQRVHEVCELLQLTPFLQRYPSELSGGQQQRIALARALVKRARLILLDEPLANLDYKLREEFRAELPGLFAASDTTVVYATTEPTEALLLGGNTAALHEGAVCQYGATHDAYRNPINLTSALTFSDPPLNCATITKKNDIFLFTENVRWAVPTGYQHLADGVYQLGFRAHQLTLNTKTTDHICWHGKITLSEINGSESLLHFNVNEHHWVAQLHGVHKLAADTQVQFYVNPAQCFLFDATGKAMAMQPNCHGKDNKQQP